MRRKTKRRESTGRKQGNKAPSRMSLYSFLLQFGSLVLAILTILGGIFYLFPRLGINASQVSPSSPVSLPLALSLSNEGYFTVTLNRVGCWVYELETDRHIQIQTLDFAYAGKNTLWPGESADFRPEHNLNVLGNLVSANVLVIIYYRQSFWPRTLQKRARLTFKGGIWQKPFLSDEDRKFKPPPGLLYN